MRSPFKILLVDDDFNLMESLADVLETKGYQVGKANSGEAALKALHDDPTYNLAVVDLILPQMNGLDLLNNIRSGLETPLAVVMVTGYGSIDSAVKAMKLGAVDYLEKPINPETLLFVIEKERDRQQLIDQNAYFMRELSERYKIENIIGLSPTMLEIFSKVKSIAASDAAILIAGESGTGKELIANHIHYSSARQKGPLIRVSCATLASGVLESELFGHEKGAFTSAISAKPGRFELAHGGTLFLDEIGDIPLSFQAKLMRVLQFMEFERVGGTKKLKSDFRIISATNHDLREDIRKGLFRQDLFFRLNTIEIELPSLRERREDIPLLLNHFIQIYSRKMNKAIRGSSSELLPVLENYYWPGNVRELKNIVERAFVYCKEDMIGLQHLPRYIYDMEPQGMDLSKLPTRSLEEVEKRLVELCLWETRNNKSRAAQMLGITRTTLISKLKKHGISASEENVPPDGN